MNIKKGFEKQKFVSPQNIFFKWLQKVLQVFENMVFECIQKFQKKKK